MRILCDRCKKQTVDFDFRNKWAHIEYSEKGVGKLGDYYLCPKCASDYYKFIDNETVIGGEEENNGCPVMKKQEEEHPQKTIVQEFLEKYPDARINNRGIPPELCPGDLGYSEAEKCGTGNNICVECWNRPLEEGEVKGGAE